MDSGKKDSKRSLVKNLSLVNETEVNREYSSLEPSKRDSYNLYHSNKQDVTLTSGGKVPADLFESYEEDEFTSSEIKDKKKGASSRKRKIKKCQKCILLTKVQEEKMQLE